jgi:hypothetical protein
MSRKRPFYAKYRKNAGDPRDCMRVPGHELSAGYSFEHGGWIVRDETADRTIATFTDESEAREFMR